MEDILNENFQKLAESLGQCVAGDEKLFHFTGESKDVRLCISKPDRIGLWFYQLCALLRSGKPYLLMLQMHTNRDGGIVKVSDIVGKWADIIMTVGKERVEEGKNPNESTILCFDNYYMDATVRDQQKLKEIAYTASCKADRFVPERTLVHQNDADEPGESASIYNEATNELFTYHYDTQKGVGKKYNMSFGLVRSTDKYKVKSHKDMIPGYDIYKQCFEACDHFNRNLHDRSWPHKRGGHGRKGDFGCQHDFIFACILQNTVNATDELNRNNGLVAKTYEQKLIELSDDIFAFAMTIVA